MSGERALCARPGYCVGLARCLAYLSEDKAASLNEQYEEATRFLSGLSKSLHKRN